jgi:hypothetical protein
VKELEKKVQELLGATRDAAISLSFPLEHNAKLNPGLLTEIISASKSERGKTTKPSSIIINVFHLIIHHQPIRFAQCASPDRHMHNLRVLQIRAAQKERRAKAGMTSATQKASELVQSFLKEGLVEKRAKIGLFIKAFVAGFCARQRAVQAERHQPGARVDPKPLLQQHLIATARGTSLSTEDTSLAYSAFMRGFEESSNFEESGADAEAPILMGIIQVSGDQANQKTGTPSALSKAEQQLPLLLNQVERTYEEVDRTVQMLTHALALERFKAKSSQESKPSPTASVLPPRSTGPRTPSSPTSTKLADCQTRTAQFLVECDDDSDEDGDSSEKRRTLNSAADHALQTMRRVLEEEEFAPAETAAARAKMTVYDSQGIASPRAHTPKFSAPTSVASNVASAALSRAKDIGRMAKAFDADLSTRIESALKNTSPSPPPQKQPLSPSSPYRNEEHSLVTVPSLTPYQAALDKYHNGGQAARLQQQMQAKKSLEEGSFHQLTNPVVNDFVPPGTDEVSGHLRPPEPPSLHESQNPKMQKSGAVGGSWPASTLLLEDGSFFMATSKIVPVPHP